MRRVFSAVLLAGLALAASAQVQGPIKIGVLYSLTGSNAVYGASGLAGTELAVTEINRAGGIAGQPIQLVVADDQSDPAKAVAEALRLVASQKVALVTGPLTSQLTLAVGPTLTQAKVMNITSAGAASLTPQALPYHFSIAATTDVEGPLMVDYAVDTLNAKKIAWLGDNGAIAKSLLAAIRAHAQKRGVELVKAEEYTYRGDDVTPQVLSLRRANPDVILMRPNTGEDHGLIMRTLSEVGWNPKIVNGGGSAATTAPALKVFQNSYKGLVNLVYKSWTYCPSDPVGQTQMGQFKQKLRAARPNDYERLNHNFSAQAYDAIYLMKYAIEGAESTSGPTLAKWLERNAGGMKTAVNGPLAASPESHFLLGSRDGMAFAIDPDQPRSDGLFRRAGC